VITRWTRVRMALCALAFLALAGLVGRRAFQLQVEQHEELRGRAEDQYLKEIELPPQRGRVLDRNEQELAATAELDSIICNPRQLRAVPDGVKKLAQALGLDHRVLRQTLERRKYFAYVKRFAAPEESQRVMALGLPGVEIRKEPKRIYPNKELGATVVGHANIDGAGVEGVELAYDRHLRGSRSQVQAMRDARGRELLFEGLLDRKTSTAGHDVVLALDRYLMYVTEQALRGAVDKWQAKGATAVMMDPNTGEVLAMVSLPSYDPNDPGEAVKRGFAKNRTITDIYEPGSTMKAFTLAAALEAGKVTPTDRVDCQSGRPYLIGKKAIKDDHPEGILTAAEVFQRSSNIGTLKIAKQLGKEPFYEALLRFGFGRRTRVGLPGEQPGMLAPARRWGDIHFATIAFGQGVAVTPLQITAAFAAIASGGIYRPPRVALRVVHPDGRVLPLPPPAGARTEERILSEKTARTMLEIMHGVTGERGTAKRAAIDGYAVGGKTGTAQKAVGGRYGNKYVASFIGVVPTDRPRLVISVIVDEPEPIHKGGIVAAPVFKEIAEAALKYLAVPARPDLLAAKNEKGKSKNLATAQIQNAPGGKRAGAAASARALNATGEAGEGPGTDEPLWNDLEPLDASALDEGGTEEDAPAPRHELVALPSFVGLSLGQAITLARRAGVEIAPEGSGVAVSQTPSPGLVPRGTLCRVSFRSGT
jgi:cell division protein FtsI (penicillin-binding protein 3)